MDEGLNVREIAAADRHRVRAAHWWFNIGNCLSARDELCRLDPKTLDHPGVFTLKWQVHAEMEDWDKCLRLAESQTISHPENVNGWLQRSVALHRLSCTVEAIRILTPMMKTFPHSWEIPYRLACFYVTIGCLTEAARCFQQALRINESAAQDAGLVDPELAELWE